MDTRREFLKKAILLSGSTGLAHVMPLSIQKALAINPQTGSTYLDAEHVVILMQENRSFDHCFGSLRGVRGFNDPRAITLPDKNLVWLQTNEAGETYAPFHFNIRDTKATWMGALPHSRASQIDAFNDGKYDQWLKAKKSNNKLYSEMPLTLGYYNREDIPFNYDMADAFTVCDQHFSSALTSTWPNRLYMWAGTIRNEKNGNSRAYVRNDIPYEEANIKTFPERLEEHGISWRVYQNDLATGGGFSGEERAWLANFICNILEYLPQYNVKASVRYVKGLQNLAETLPKEIADLQSQVNSPGIADKVAEKVGKEIIKKKEILNDTEQGLLKWGKESFNKLSQHQKNLYNRAFTTNVGDSDFHKLETLRYVENGEQRELLIPKGDALYQFRKDVDAGTLPTVSWLVPSQNLSDHPSAPWYGSWYTSEILDILTKNPEIWKKTIFILTYDENDGYFDHVPPFVAPDPKNPQRGKCSEGVNVTGVEFIRREQEIKEGVPKKGARTGPIGLGFRVPMIIASPWSRGGKVCSQVFDHTSVLQFLEDFLSKKFKKEIKQDAISEWRRTVCGNLTSAFNMYKGVENDRFPFLSKDPLIQKIYNAKFKNEPLSRRLSVDEIAGINRDPSSSQLIPHQEPGIRPASSLPYQLYAEGNLNFDKKAFELIMRAENEIFNSRSAGSPFIVYAPGKYFSNDEKSRNNQSFESARNWHYAVKAGDSLTDWWPLSSFEDGNYHLRVYGPNGYFREFKGNLNDPFLNVQCEYQRSRLFKSKATGNIELKIKNLNPGKSYNVEIIDKEYKNKTIYRTIPALGEDAIILELGSSHGWYDFTLGIKNNVSFFKRFAGRIETGRESFSDPAMGKVLI